MATTTVDSGSYLSGLSTKFSRGWADFRLGYAREPMKYSLLIAAVIILGLLVVYPIWLLFQFSIVDPKGGLTAANYIEVTQRKDLFNALLNTLLLGVLVPLGCLLLGLPMAWMVSRTNMPGKLFVRAFAGIAFVIPSFIGMIIQDALKTFDRSLQLLFRAALLFFVPLNQVIELIDKD